MPELRAADRYEITVDDAPAPQRWFRALAALVLNAASSFNGSGEGPSNPGGRRVKVVEQGTGHVVFEFVENFGDDAQVSLSTIQADMESQTLAEFQSKWL